MDTTTTACLEAAPRTAEPGSDPHAAIVDQLQRTLMLLVRATLERARGDAAAGAPGALAQTAVFRLLTQREREVLQRIAAGDSNKMIARALALSPHTVKRHVANILDKLGARSRSQAAAWLLRAH
ncbi:MAG TPA: LuxR C-terminal-related transcriptional regulator [Burkholderiaceae bacterium]